MKNITRVTVGVGVAGAGGMSYKMIFIHVLFLPQVRTHLRPGMYFHKNNYFYVLHDAPPILSML